MLSMLRRLAWLAAFLLSACAASRPTFDESVVGSESIPEGKARLVFFRTRDSGLYIARQAAVSLDGNKVGGAGYGSFFVHDIDSGRHSLKADMWDMPDQ